MTDENADEGATKIAAGTWKDYFDRAASPLIAFGMFAAVVTGAIAKWDGFKAKFNESSVLAY